ncbi:MAG: HTH domain-containing protein [Clostridia bacterium]
MIYYFQHKWRRDSDIKGRQLEILIYLLKHKKTTYKTLAENFEVSSKTIERDISTLSTIGIPVYCSQGVGGGVFIDENYKFGASFFSESDLHQIIFALKIMNGLSNNPGKSKIVDKLCLIAPELSAMFENDAENYLSIDLLTENVDVEEWIYQKIDFCLDNEVLAIVDDKIKVAAIGYVLKSDGLYLFCHSTEYLLIKCQNIKSIELTEEPFERKFITYEEFKKTQKQASLKSTSN